MTDNLYVAITRPLYRTGGIPMLFNHLLNRVRRRRIPQSERPAALIISHRANMKVAPENTIAGIESAIADCVDGVEIDVQATADGVAVLIHDRSLRRACDDPRSIEQLTASEAGQLQVKPPTADVSPEPIATLAGALEAAAGRTVLVLDVKMTGIAEIIASTIEEHGQRTEIHLQADFEEAEEYRRLLPDIPLTIGLRAKAIKELGIDALLDRCVRLGASGVSIRNRILHRCQVDRAHARGLLVKTWTVDRVPDVERVLATGVDAVCGNYPLMIRAVREQVERSQEATRAAA